jgi:uncharacterized protein (TIGR03435 family)
MEVYRRVRLTQRLTAVAAGFSLSLLLIAVAGSAQTRKPAAAPAFEVVSLKHTGNLQDGGRSEGGRTYVRPFRSLQYRGVKLSGEMPLDFILQFAYSPLVKPWRFEGPEWVKHNEEFYQIEAIAPAGTTIDGARAMLRTALAQRLGFQYHMVDRDTPIYALVRGTGELKLTPSTEPEPNPGAMRMGAFKKKSASLEVFASFLSSLTDHEVFDKTGIQGLYKFDVDWSKEIQDSMQDYGRSGNPAIARERVKSLGLKLEPRKEPLKVMVVDHVNKEPTPN